MEHMSKCLHEKLTRYNWVGFYLVDPADANYLIVGPFTGSFTPNARFQVSVGLCGAAATSGKVWWCRTWRKIRVICLDRR